MSALATKEDFEARHGAGDDRVEALLDDASALIRSEISGGFAEWVREDEPKSVPGIVKAICIEIAYQAWNNPDRLSSERLGEHVVSWQGSSSGQVLEVTDNQLRILRREAGKSSFRSVQMRVHNCRKSEGEITSVSDNDLFPISE